jgi:hypothetical protein
METISGIKFAETDSLMEFVLWGSVLGALLLIRLCFCINRVRSRAALCSKKWCGVLHFDLQIQLGGNAEAILAEFEEWEAPKCSALLLRAVNGVQIVVSLVIFGVTVYFLVQQVISLPMASPILGITTILGLLGRYGYGAAYSKGRGVSCYILVYMFAAAIAFIVATYMVVTTAADTSVDSYADKHFDSLCNVLNNEEQATCDEAAADPAARELVLDDISDQMSANVSAIIGVLGGMLLLLLSGVAISAAVVSHRILVGSAFTVIGYVLVAFGCTLMAASAWSANTYGPGTAVYNLALSTAVCGVWMAGVAMFGLVSTF